MADDIPAFPDQEQLEKELSEYLSRKYGQRIKVISPMTTRQHKDSQDAQKKPDGLDRIRFDMKPEELLRYLDQYVVRQDEAKAVLATKICTHYNRAKFLRRRARYGDEEAVGRVKNNILLIGPTGVGKTYLVKLIANKLGVPFVKGDATKFSETGYVGGDVEDLVRELVAEANDDIELAEHGIIYVDEVDKIASSHHFIGPDVSRTGVQRALLKPMEETEVDLKVPHDPVSQIQAIEQYRKTGKREKRTVNTRNILFIMSGAFNGLAPIVKRRMQKQGLGFGAEVRSREDDFRFLKHIKAEDLIEYGFESEFIGRLPVVAVLDPLEVEDLYQILKNARNPIIQGKKEDFRSYGIDIKFRDDALHLVAERAYSEKTGARGLVSVIEKVLLSYEMTLPSSAVRYAVITGDVVRDPQGELRRLIEHPNDPEMIEAYEEIIGEEKERIREEVMARRREYVENYPAVFSPDRIELIIEHHMKTDFPLEGIFDEVILLYNQVRVFETDFYEKHGYKINFDEEAINEIIREALEEDTSASAICSKISSDYDYGFKLISDRSGQTRFILPRKAVVEHVTYLDELIRENYRQYPIGPSEMQKER
ncbi:MAG: AAA family ATPase [Syntrophobacteraceae bacterium]|nr:AAA family ATPase [Syntrophobacteraceae bacterium]